MRAPLSALLLLLGSARAFAQTAYPVTLVAAVPGDAPEVDHTILVGSSGQLYRRADDGSWGRQSAGGLSADLRGAARAPDGVLIAAGAHAPIFRFEGGAWHARPLPNRGDVGAPAPGSSPVVSVGRHLYALDKGRWRRVTEAARPMSLVWAAGPGRIWVADAQGGLYRSAGGGFTLVRHGLAATDVIVAMAGAAESELYALSTTGVLLALHPGTATAVAVPELAGLRIDAIGPAPGGLVVAGVVAGAGAERPLLVRVARGRMQLDGDLPALPASDRAVLVRGDAAGGVLVASARGRLLLRRGAAPFGQAAVSGALPAGTARSFPRALPAHTR